MALRYSLLEKIEKNAGLLAIAIAFMVSMGGLSEITPLFSNATAVTPAPGVEPYDPLRLAGRDLYVSEGCYGCHSQMIRTQRFETQRYGPNSIAGESVYDRPFQWGSKRTGPDLARIGGKYTDEWHRLHMATPRAVVPESNMPGYPWLNQQAVDGRDIQRRMIALRRLGDPYTDAQIAAAPDAVKGRTAMDAMIAYLQGLGLDRSGPTASADDAGPAPSAAIPGGARQPAGQGEAAAQVQSAAQGEAAVQVQSAAPGQSAGQREPAGQGE